MDKKINGYLSRILQEVYPDALVVCVGDESWAVERPDSVVGIGSSFNEAKQAVHAIIAAERNRRSDGGN